MTEQQFSKEKNGFDRYFCEKINFLDWEYLVTNHIIVIFC
jgi:hypothetical protein